MKSLNRYFALIWLILVFLGVLFWSSFKGKFDWLNIMLFTEYLCILYLFNNSRSLKSRKAPLLLVGVGLSFIAILFRIMKWPGAFELQIASVAMITFGYLLFFANHTRQRLPDIFKLAWVVSAAFSLLWTLFRMPDPFKVELISGLLFWPMYISVCISEARGNDQSVEEEVENELPEDVI